MSEPALDLAVAMSIVSAKTNKVVHAKMVAFGEVGLAGEVRPVPGINQRIQEASRLGYTHALVPASANGPGPIPPDFTVKQIEHIAEATELLLHL